MLSGIPDLTDHITMNKRPTAFHTSGVTFEGTWNTPYESSPVSVSKLLVDNQRS